jgi:hypothetical protein
MSDKQCPVCDEPFKDGDRVVAVMLSVFHEIPSDVHYAIEQPTACVEIVHSACYDWADHEPPEEILS